jgi:hypothetical protein
MILEAQKEADPETWEQSFSSVVRELPVEGLRRLPREAAWDLHQARERSIRDMAEDPYACGWEPAMWRKMLLWLAKKRLALPNRVLVFYVLGGMRSGKTDVGGKRLAQHTAAYERLTPVGQYKVWAWGIHQNEKRSQDLGQKRAHDYLPRAWRDAKFTKKMGAAFSYFSGKGFTGNQFVVDGRLCQFMFAGMDPTVLQGPELTFAWLDEELPPSICTTVEERLSTHAAQAGNRRHIELVKGILVKLEAGQKIRPDEVAALHLGVCLHTFTPKEGWTKVVADALNGAETLEEEMAPALPIEGPVRGDGTREVTGYMTAPRVKQCKDPAKMIFYIWTQDNPFGGYEALLGTYKNKTEQERRVALYGDVQKDWKTAYPKYETAKHAALTLAQAPRDVTIRRYVDAAEARPLFTVWMGTDRVGRDYVLNEWPREGDYIPGVGDPGAWAEPSAGEKKDGDAGPAQKLIWFGYRDYIQEWERVERQLAAWKSGVDDPFSLSLEELKKWEPVKVYEEQMDSRLGNAPTMNEGGKSTMMDDFNDLGCDFVPAAGDRLKEGDKKINDALRDMSEEDGERGGRGHGLFSGPRLLVCEHCLAIRFMLENYTGLDGAKGACKDARDALVFHLTNDDRGFKEGVEWTSSVRGKGRDMRNGIGDWGKG